MNECAAAILGEHDFTSFSKKNVQLDHSRCTILNASWSERESSIVFEISANRFLHHMVRSLVGEMVQVGKGEKTVEEFKNLLLAPFRADIGKIAPARGLVLREVVY
jgi:tRNA pseudouridine38-40 synthase